MAGEFRPARLPTKYVVANPEFISTIITIEAKAEPVAIVLQKWLIFFNSNKMNANTALKNARKLMKASFESAENIILLLRYAQIAGKSTARQHNIRL